MNNLILTIAHGYDYPFLEPFFKSLQEVGYTGDLVVFASDKVSRATKRKIKESGGKIIDYCSRHPFKGYETAFNHITPSITINNYRFIYYLQFLKKHVNSYDMVMLTDVRDVLFQKDPFLQCGSNEISFFLEDNSQDFHHRFNYEWLAEAAGKQSADKLINKVVSCAGVTIGAVSSIISYLEYIKSKLVGRAQLNWGLDQGIHNSYIYLERPGDMRLFDSEEPYVINLGAYQPYQTNSAGEVVNSKGEVYAVVHQYDRSGALFAMMKERYIGSRLLQKIKRIYYLLMP